MLPTDLESSTLQSTRTLQMDVHKQKVSFEDLSSPFYSPREKLFAPFFASGNTEIIPLK